MSKVGGIMLNRKVISMGIMVCPIKKNLFYEKDFYKQLFKTGKEQDVDTFVFYPNSIDWKKKIIKGFQFDPYSNKFQSKIFPFPHFIYDRCFYLTAQEYRTYIPYVKRIKQDAKIQFLGEGLNGKWEVYEILSTNPLFKVHLPKTALYRNTKQLFHWLSLTPIVLKPTGGSHGRGVIKVNSKKQGYEITGRTNQNQKIHKLYKNKSELADAIQTISYGRKYAIQQYLPLTTSQNEPYDIRVLVQKNEIGSWEMTGMAARIGDADNITSNLHGGGYVESVEKIIKTEFSVQKADDILTQIHSFSKTIPPFIEQSHGSIFELGLDLGIDKKGKVWIIEVNSKPGRSVFSIMGDEQTSYKSMVQPILYTRHLAKNQLLGGNVKNEYHFH